MKRGGFWAIAAGVTGLVLALIWAAPPPPDGNHVTGTAGYDTAEAGDSAATLNDLETVTGAIDPHELIGQRVDFHLRVAHIVNDTTFWIGTRDNRVLVVPRNGGRRLADGQLVRIVGTIEQLRPELDDQKIYIRADSVTAEP